VLPKKCFHCGEYYFGDECLVCHDKLFDGENDLPDCFKEIFGTSKKEE